MISILRISDISHEFAQLLSYLSPVNANLDEIEHQYLNKRETDMVFVCRKGDILVATATLHFEEKFSHNLGTVGHIEDVVVHPKFRDQHIGKELIEHLVAVARGNNCYKVILNCADENVPFYEKCGFKKHEVSMRMDLNAGPGETTETRETKTEGEGTAEENFLTGLFFDLRIGTANVPCV